MDSTKICIVDDETDLTDVYLQYLGNDFSVRTFSSAEDALKTFSQEGYAPDLIVTDIKMPHVTGLEFMDRLKESGSQVPVIVISGHANKEHALGAIERKASGFLEKPFEPKQLRAVIEKTMGDVAFEKESGLLLKKYREYALAASELIGRYRERYQTAENVVFDKDLPIRPDRVEIKKFVEGIGIENELERSLDRLAAELRKLEVEHGCRSPARVPISRGSGSSN